MVAYDKRLDSDQKQIEYLLALARQTMQQYGLQGARIELISAAQHVAFSLEFSQQAAWAVHPYLGRLAGKRFTLRLHGACSCTQASIRAELEWLATLLRDTDLSLPEPVPALDGRLIPVVRADESGQIWRCVLVRWLGTDAEEIDVTTQRERTPSETVR